MGSANRLWAQITRVPAVNAVNQNSRYLLNSVEAFICWMRKREKNGVRLELEHTVEIEVSLGNHFDASAVSCRLDEEACNLMCYWELTWIVRK